MAAQAAPPEQEYAALRSWFPALETCAYDDFLSLRRKDVDEVLDSVGDLGRRGRLNRLWTEGQQQQQQQQQQEKAAPSPKIKAKGKAKVRHGAMTLLRASSSASISSASSSTSSSSSGRVAAAEPRRRSRGSSSASKGAAVDAVRARSRTLEGGGGGGRRRAKSAAARPKKAKGGGGGGKSKIPAARNATLRARSRSRGGGGGASDDEPPAGRGGGGGSHESILASAVQRRGRSRTMSVDLMDSTRERARVEEAAVLTVEVAEWMAGIVGNPGLAPKAPGADAPGEFVAALASGVDLCLLVRKACPEGSAPRREVARFAERAAAGSFPARDNVTRFLAAARAAGVPDVCMFETEDVFRGGAEQARRVVNCILQLARALSERFGTPPPLIVRYELEIDRAEAAEPLATITEESEDAGIPRSGNPLDADVVRAVRAAGGASLRVRGVKGREGLYRVGEGAARVTVAIRSVRGLLMVRVGGGWISLANFCERKLNSFAAKKTHRVALSQSLGRARSSSSVLGVELRGDAADGRTATLKM